MADVAVAAIVRQAKLLRTESRRRCSDDMGSLTAPHIVAAVERHERSTFAVSDKCVLLHAQGRSYAIMLVWYNIIIKGFRLIAAIVGDA